MIEQGISAEGVALLHWIIRKILEHEVEESINHDAFIAVADY